MLLLKVFNGQFGTLGINASETEIKCGYLFEPRKVFANKD